jgi:hypothetical protein
MRDNGLGANRHISYAVLADLTPPEADAMLDVLRRQGIAAYAEPSPGERSVTMAVTFPGGPVDRLWVDAAELEAARSALRDHLGTMPTTVADPIADPIADPVAGPAFDEDAAWRQIVESFDMPAAEPVPRWPAEEDVDASTVTFGRRRDDAEPPAFSYAEPDDEPDNEPDNEPRYAEDEDHYVPPLPPPIPRAQAATKAAIAALVGGVAMLVISTVTDVQDADVLAFLGVVAIVAGFVTLVARMRDAPPTDSGPDDGAVV